MCPRGKFTAEEAEPMIPNIVKRIAELAVDCTICLDKYPINSYAVESKIMGIQGYANYLVKCAKAVWKNPPKPKRVTKR